MTAPYGDGRFANEPPSGSGLNITDIFHIVKPKPDDPGIDSKVDSQYPNVAIITFDEPNQFGGMWAKEKLDLTLPFATEMYLHLGHQYVGGSKAPADGMTFTLHNDPAGLNAIGGAGEGLGVYKGRKWAGVGELTVPHGAPLKNSLVVEFDTYRNRISRDSFVDDPGNADSSHCSLLTPRATVIRIIDHRNTRTFTPSQDWVRFEAKWTPNNSGGGTFDYTFIGDKMTYRVDNIISTFGSSEVYWGFTGATGLQTSVQAAALVKLPEQGISAEKTVKNEAGEGIDQGIAFPGATIRYTIRVTVNLLTGQIGPIVIDDVLSEFVEYAGGEVNITTSTGVVDDVAPIFSGNAMNISTDQSLTEEGDWLEAAFNVRVKDTAGGEIVYNQASITADGLPESKETNTTMVTIFADPEKTVSARSEAGQGGGAVKVGDMITYNISYGNSGATASTITIVDRLADGVDCESVSDGGVYDGATHTVTWSIPDVESGVGGIVSVVVSVNETAVVTIENYAIVQVGGTEPRITNTVVNPVVPDNPIKMVSSTSEAGRGGDMVKTGDLVTYDIIYLNYKETPATVFVTDKLPTGVNFMSATNGGQHDVSTGVVTWALTDVPSGVSGLVSLVIEVNESAVVKIENYAIVQVDNDGALATNSVINPVQPSDPKKKVSERSAAGRGGAMVKVGDRITYDITYSNYQKTAATMVIVDNLPVGVNFVSAANGGVYDESTHAVTWVLADVESGVKGSVSFMVQVNEDAVVRIENYASVQVGLHGPATTNIVVNPVILLRCPDISQNTGQLCRKTITGCKIWADNDNVNNTRPDSVEIVLLRDGEVYRRKTIDAAGDGNYIFACLPIWKNSEDRYSYKIDEPEVPDRYSKTIEGYDVINTLTMFDV